MEEPPFKFTRGIAELSSDAKFGSGLLVPEPHVSTRGACDDKGKRLSYFQSHLILTFSNQVFTFATQSIIVMHLNLYM